ncbi:hypothetical protein [Helicobacter fennelliae]|uniref:hypothetical protein n=1 Tax=Helicobacter fennelliae TaxID=215 RepID=UPI000DD2DD33|nr:hypothetical protein [Helicobacter fennelliae]
MSLASNAKFGAYQIALDSSLGYRLKWRHSALKPYIWLNQYLNIQNAITDSELLQFKASSYLVYILDAVAGVRYDLYPNLDFNLLSMRDMSGHWRILIRILRYMWLIILCISHRHTRTKSHSILAEVGISRAISLCR